jgi:uncharacterized protein YggE
MKYPLLVFLILITSLSFSQASLIDNSRYIKVSGSAEIEITPNKIIIAAYLSERIERKEKINLSLIEKRFNDIIQQLGIAKDKISLDKAEGRYTQIKKRRSDILASKVMLIEFGDVVLANDFLDALKDADIANDIRKKTHTDLPRFRKETKIEAVKAAKAKAEYLIKAAGANVGRVLRVIESDERSFGGAITSQSNIRSNNYGSNSGQLSTTTSNQQFSPIKMRYVMDVIYEIVD